MTGQATDFRSDWPGLDLLKCLGVVGMILAQGIYFIWTYSGNLAIGENHPSYPFIQSLTFLGFFPLMLPFIAGATFYLRLAPRLENKERTLTTVLLIQCAMVALVGYAMNVLSAGWYALPCWNVLQTVAGSMVIIAALSGSRLGVWSVAFAGLLLLASSDPLRAWWPPESRSAIARILLGDPDDLHTWPPVPWFGLVAFGFVLAHGYRRVGSASMFAGGSALLGLALMLAAATT